jgi:salicylate hydroxylase
MDAAALHIAVIGGGIGGLSCAVSFLRLGANVTVFEQAQAFSEVGAGVQLSPNASRVLIALGLKEQLTRIASRPAAIVLRDGIGGHKLFTLALGDHIIARHGAPYFHLHRADLIAILAQSFREAGGRIVFDARVDDAAPDGRVERGGASEQFDLVVAADGVKSRTRAKTFGGSAPYFTGHIAYRAIAAGRYGAQDAATNWMGPGRHVVTYPLARAGGMETNIVAVAPAQGDVEHGWYLSVNGAQVGKMFDDFAGPVHQMFDAIEEISGWAIYAHHPLANWSNGRVVALGDAAHAMPPYLAQGAGMAIEDGWVLTDCIKRSEDIGKALIAYQAQRAPRVERVQKAALKNGLLYHASGVRRLVQNAGMRAMARSAPRLLSRRYDWLHGFDALT